MSKTLNVYDWETDELLDGTPSDELAKVSAVGERGSVGAVLRDGVWLFWQPSMPEPFPPPDRRSVYVADKPDPLG